MTVILKINENDIDEVLRALVNISATGILIGYIEVTVDGETVILKKRVQ